MPLKGIEAALRRLFSPRSSVPKASPRPKTNSCEPSTLATHQSLSGAFSFAPRSVRLRPRFALIDLRRDRSLLHPHRLRAAPGLSVSIRSFSLDEAQADLIANFVEQRGGASELTVRIMKLGEQVPTIVDLQAWGAASKEVDSLDTLFVATSRS